MWNSPSRQTQMLAVGMIGLVTFMQLIAKSPHLKNFVFAPQIQDVSFAEIQSSNVSAQDKDGNRLQSIQEHKNESDALPLSITTEQRILEQTKSLRVFVYSSPNITLTHLRDRVVADKYTWRFKWGTRFKVYAKWEVRYLAALEEEEASGRFIRVDDPSQADIYVVPIPWGAIYTASDAPARDGRRALDTLYEQEWFQRFPDRHVTMSFIEPLFEKAKAPIMRGQIGVDDRDYIALQYTTLVTDVDNWLWDSFQAKGIPQRGYWSDSPGTVNKRGWSVSLMGAASDPGLPVRQATWNSWRNRTFQFFYHTTKSSSTSNSTQFRHFPVIVADQLVQPSSVSYDIPVEQWLREYADSRFCLAIRGDRPYSRALARSLRNACIPVVVSEMLPAYSPMFRSLLPLRDYAVVVSERDFLLNPAETLNSATTSLSKKDIVRLLSGIEVMQKLIIPDHPDGSLFVPAFLAETLASQQPEYYDINRNDELNWNYTLMDI